MSATPFRRALAAALGAFAACAHAADQQTLPAVEVNGRYDNAVGSADAASQGTVGAKLIDTRPVQRPGELLEFVPGMIVTQHSGEGKGNQYFLRGFNLDHGTDFAIYLDDIPVNMRSHAHGQGYADLNFLIPELVRRIDYKKGPYFADEGDFSSVGSARLRLADSLPRGIASLTAGSFGYRRLMLGDSAAMAGGNLLYGLELARDDGPWSNPQDMRKFSALLRYSPGNANDGYSLTGMAYRNKWNSTDQMPLRVVDSGRISRFGAIDPSDGGRASRYSLSWAMHKRNENGVFEASAYALQSSLDLFSNFTFFLGDPVNGDQFNQSERRRMAGFNVSRTWFNKFGGFEMQNRVGLQTRHDRLAPVGLYSTVAQTRIATTREDRVSEGSVAIFVENGTQWLPKLRSVAGLRFDSYRFKVDSGIAGNSGKASAQIVSPKLSLIFGPWAKTEFFANYGQGFHSNDARGTTQTQLPAGGGPGSPVTPLVKTSGAELGVRTEMLPGLQSSLSLWTLKIASELVFVGDAGDTQPSRASKRYGIEWSNHYAATSWLLFDLNLAASGARYTQDDPAGNYVPGALDRVASFGVAVNDRGPWSGALQVRYFGPRPLIEDNSVRSAATALTYVRMGYRINREARLSLDIFNLFNRKDSDIDYYYASRLQGEPTAGVNDIHFHPVLPRSARLSLTLNF